ncbi:MAG: type VI secretion system tube protein Hcp [Roseibacillus sp.]|nr:type VI secretion system tube protein Hcp [Roseibacillus sp.]|tara:strand:- start:84 stop:587 length:504 start_codon:yes stop_codon:yes gene_type:complete
MPTPAYAFFTDENGEDIVGGVTIEDDREVAESVEVIEFEHEVYIPTDRQTGKPTGVRMHNPVQIVKAYDQASPLLFEACCNGTTLEEVTIKWYRIDALGAQEEYFNHVLERVRVCKIESYMPNTKDPTKESLTHLEKVSLMYDKITWTYVDGSIETTDAWLGEAEPE